MSEDEIWDEEQWEAFLRENDRRVDHYTHLLFSFMAVHPPPAQEDAVALRDWEADLRRFLRSNGLVHPDDVMPFLSSEAPPEDAPGEGSVADLDDEALEDEFIHLQQVPVYQHALDLSVAVLDWSNALPGDLKDSTLVQFCSHLTQVPAQVAQGHGIGYERDMIGGNIACVKRGLAAANAALELLREMKTAPYMTARIYGHLSERTFEMRNALGLYVQDLRARFHLGID